ncbi:CBS domain-containing protein [bacterium]|nr:CBS domain-containing protein [bacterium]
MQGKLLQIMTSSPETVTSDESVEDALRKMRQQKCRHLPILDDETLVGIVSDRELRGYVLPTDALEADWDMIRARLQEPISHISQSNPLTLGPDDEIDDAIELMLEQDIGAIPVVEPAEGYLMGMVSYVDILRHALR